MGATTQERREGVGRRSTALAEVEWYFQLAETEMGAPSNFGRVLASVGPDGHWRTPEDQAEAVTAYRRIRTWLYAMPNSEAGVLQAAYEPKPWPAALRERFGDLTGIAVRLTCPLKDWPEDRRLQELMDKARARALDGRCRCPDKEWEFLERLEDRARARFETALAAYLRVRRAARPVLPPHAWKQVCR